MLNGMLFLHRNVCALCVDRLFHISIYRYIQKKMRFLWENKTCLPCFALNNDWAG